MYVHPIFIVPFVTLFLFGWGVIIGGGILKKRRKAEQFEQLSRELGKINFAALTTIKSPVGGVFGFLDNLIRSDWNYTEFCDNYSLTTPTNPFELYYKATESIQKAGKEKLDSLHGLVERGFTGTEDFFISNLPDHLKDLDVLYSWNNCSFRGFHDPDESFTEESYKELIEKLYAIRVQWRYQRLRNYATFPNRNVQEEFRFLKNDIRNAGGLSHAELTEEMLKDLTQTWSKKILEIVSA